MAAPTQVYPPWLTALPTVLFDGNGEPTATETTVLFLPLTYYGPSIPLGPDWIYGGLTSPATTSTIPPVTTATQFSATTSTEIPLTTTTATPTSTSLATPIPFTASSLPISDSMTMTTLSATPTSFAEPSHHLSRGGLIGVIVGSILGLIFLFIAAILLYLCMKGRRRRQGDPEGMLQTTEQRRTQHLTPFAYPWASYSNSSYHIVGWNDRSPRSSGGEADPFLAHTTDEVPQPVAANSNVPPFVTITRVPVPATGSQSSKGSAGTSGTNHSGYGVLVDRPTLNLQPGTTAEIERQRRGPILTTEELDRINEEAVLPQENEGELSPLHSPPSSLDPNEGWSSGNPHSPSLNTFPLLFAKRPSQNSLSAYPDADEAATLLTARRVRVEELTSRAPPRLVGSFGEACTRNSNRGLLNSLGLDRLSWFRNSDSSSRRSSRTNGYSVSPLAQEDPEIGKALLSPEMSELPAPRPGLAVFEGDRPISTVSGISGTTVYHDAHSSPGTPISPTSPTAPITPLPRALTPSGSIVPQLGRPANSSPIPPVPPVPDLTYTSQSCPSSIPDISHGLPVDVDVLDMPVPAAVSPFASSIKTSNSGMTDGTDELKVHPFPPGLVPPSQNSGKDEGSSIAHVPPPIRLVNAPVTTSSTLSSMDTATAISFDVLEEAPPSAGEGWRNLAAEQGMLGRRTTFGIPIPSPVMSEQCSLYSTNSHLGPSHARSTGSDPNSSRRDLSGSVSSVSSRPSAMSTARSHSLVHSESVSSESRKRPSPVMSAFGPRPRPTPPLPSPLLNVPQTVHYPPERAGTHRMSGSHDMDAERNGSSSEPTSPLSHMSSAPWAGGLGDNWMPSP